jgi:hypothetical protein
VADRQPSASAQFSALLSRFPAEIVARVKRCLPKLRRAFPGTSQIVYEYSKSLVVSFSPSERGYDGIVSVAIFADGVRLYFRKDVPDPKGLLEGSGTQVRSVTVEAASDLDRGDIHDLIRAAIAHSGITFPRTGSNPMIIQSTSKTKSTSASKKKTPKQTGRA